MEVDQVLKELNTNPHQGLSVEEVRSRLEKYGYNELKKEEKISAFSIFINQFKNILIIILLIAIGLSAAVGEVVDAAIIGVIVVFCAVLGLIQEYRAERALEALKKMLSPTITVLRGGKEEEVPRKNLFQEIYCFWRQGTRFLQMPESLKAILSDAMRRLSPESPYP